MKDKLLKVKDMLMQLESVNYQIGYGDALKVTGEYEIAGREEIRAESLALLDSIISMLDSPWQPIESAPMDGTEIVIQDMYYDKNGNKNLGERYVAYYQPEEACWFDGSGTWIDVCPDYWMPLPSIESIRDKDNGSKN